MKNISRYEWDAMSLGDKTVWLEKNCKSSATSHRKSLVYGVGVNDSSYCVSPAMDGRKLVCPAYDAWKAMLRRCYDSKFHQENKTYIGVSVCDEWHTFMSFRKWWLEHQVDGWQIDKDLISDSRCYSPEACTFVPRWLNVFANRRASSDNHKTGAHLRKDIGRFMSYCKNPFTGKLESLGHFDDALSAHNAWLSRKLEFSERLKPLMDEIDERIYPRIVDIINCAT